MATPTPEFEATAVILAGGQSIRMGRDKALLDWQGQPLILHIARQLEPHFTRVCISGPAQRYGAFGYSVVEDHFTDCGPLAGIHAALTVSGDAWHFVTTCDLPVLPLDLIRTLYARRFEADCVVTVDAAGKRNPLFGFYHAPLADVAARLLEEQTNSVQRLLDEARTLCLETSSQLLADLDTPSEYSKRRPQ